jgi:spore coat protein U-like protein
MKRYFVAAVAVALVAAAGVAVAATTDVTVNATVLEACAFRSVPTVNFPALDPATGAAVDSPTVNLTFNCTSGVGYTLTDPNNPLVGDGTYSGNLSDASANTIPYTLTYTNFTGTGAGGGAGNEISSAITGHILAGNYDSAPAGSYTEVVTFTITP